MCTDMRDAGCRRQLDLIRDEILFHSSTEPIRIGINVRWSCRDTGDTDTASGATVARSLPIYYYFRTDTLSILLYSVWPVKS